MTLIELEIQRDQLRQILNVKNREELKERFNQWDLETSKQINAAYKLDRLEFLTAAGN